MKYQKQFGALAEFVRASKGREDAEARAVISLHRDFTHYNWVGIYRLEGSHLVLGSYQGKPTEHVRIPIGQGICGSAAVSQRTEVVPDVGADARYLACFAETSSEIVVPIIKGGKLWGEIDIDSNQRHAFGPDDVELLEAVAKLLAEWV